MFKLNLLAKWIVSVTKINLNSHISIKNEVFILNQKFWSKMGPRILCTEEPGYLLYPGTSNSIPRRNFLKNVHGWFRENGISKKLSEFPSKPVAAIKSDK